MDNKDNKANGEPTGLTEEQQEAVQASWKLMHDDWKTNGMEYWVKLLIEYPGIRKFFKQFNGVKDSELVKSRKLRAHVITFGGGLSSFVDNIDDTDCLVILVQKLVGNHFRRKIDTVQLYKDAFGCFLDYMRDKFNLDIMTVEAWEKVFETLYGVIDEELKNLHEESGTA